MNASPPRRLRLRPPVEREDDLHERVAKVLTYLVLPPVMWTTFPAGHVQLPAHAAARLARCGLKRGWPDILLVYQRAAYGIELKREGGRISTTRTVRTARGTLRELEGQDRTFPRLIAAGMAIAVCHDVGEVLEALDRWGIPRRRTT